MGRIKKWEIWIGYYHLGQGYSEPTEPQQVGLMEASSFEIACFLYEHQAAFEQIATADKNGQVINNNDMIWFYNAEENRNAWFGKYYPSREEALKSFNKSSNLTIIKS